MLLATVAAVCGCSRTERTGTVGKALGNLVEEDAGLQPIEAPKDASVTAPVAAHADVQTTNATAALDVDPCVKLEQVADVAERVLLFTGGGHRSFETSEEPFIATSFSISTTVALKGAPIQEVVLQGGEIGDRRVLTVGPLPPQAAHAYLGLFFPSTGSVFSSVLIAPVEGDDITFGDRKCSLSTLIANTAPQTRSQ